MRIINKRIISRLLLTAFSAGTLTAIAAEALPEPYKPASENQLLTLGKPKKARFNLTDITWPKNPGDAEVCLWKDDKYAAASLVIDDNCRPNHKFWLDLCKKHGIKVTFFVITGPVDGTNAGFAGTWEEWRKVYATGLAAVESHAVNHNSNDNKRPDDEVRYEYAVSQKMIRDKIPGNPCTTFAIPWGKGKTAIATDYYSAIRGVSGMINEANRIDYSNVCMGGLSPAYIDVLLTGKTDKSPKWLSRAKSRRGWIAPLHHFVRPEKEAEVAAAVANLAVHKDQIWIDTFPAVAHYAQERDSATLKTVKVEANSIELSLNDKMYDVVFNAPLTIKVRLPDAWKDLSATQDGKAIAAVFLAHDGIPYALVQAVPDRGAVVLTKK